MLPLPCNDCNTTNFTHVKSELRLVVMSVGNQLLSYSRENGLGTHTKPELLRLVSVNSATTHLNTNPLGWDESNSYWSLLRSLDSRLCGVMQRTSAPSEHIQALQIGTISVMNSSTMIINSFGSCTQRGTNTSSFQSRILCPAISVLK
jgi:hypothetical protein